MSALLPLPSLSLIGFILITMVRMVSVRAAESGVAQSQKPLLTEAGSRSRPWVVERGPHDRVWQWTVSETNEFGVELVATNSFTEVATGLHFRGTDGEWQETVAAFEVVGDGFVAARGPHQVALAGDLNVAGAVTLVTPEGQTLRSTPTLLAFVDRSTGEHVRIADLKPTRGELVEPNVVLYSDAFDTIAADVRGVYTAAGFEFDVILRRQLPDPTLLGLDPATTDVAVFTEFFGTKPTAEQIVELPLSDQETATDTHLEFSGLVMEGGRAFGLDTQPGKAVPEVRVRKSWELFEGRDFLVERTAYADLQPLLAELPEASVPTPAHRRAMDRQQRTATLELPKRSRTSPAWVRNPQGRLMAAGISRGGPAEVALHRPPERKAPGVVLDWAAVTTTANQTFDGLTTYYVTGPVNLTGAVTFRAGTVIKYANANSPSLNVLSGATIVWQGAPYRPVVLTARDDDSVGEPLPGSSGTPTGTYATVALSVNGSALAADVTLANLCIRNAALGLSATHFGNRNLTLRHAQFVNCDAACTFQYGATANDSFFVQNALIVGTSSSKVFKNLYSARVRCEFVTADTATALSQGVYGPNDYSTLSMVNSLIVNVAGSTNATMVNSGTPPANLGSVFVTAGAGAHYLNLANLGIRDWFATSFQAPINQITDMSLQADLFGMTVTAPAIMIGAVTSDVLLAPRPESIDAAIDYIGYQYYPIHFLAQEVTVNGASLAVSNGVVVAGIGTSAFTLGSGARFASQGRPDALNRLCWASAVQELPLGGAPAAATRRNLIEVATGASVWPELRLRFTRADFMANTPSRRGVFNVLLSGQNLAIADLRDCQLNGAYLSFSPVSYGVPSLSLFNNLFENCTVGAYRNYAGQFNVTARNNLFRGGGFTLYNYFVDSSNPVWVCTDNLFDGAGLGAYTTSTNFLTAGWNGYTAATALFGGSGNKINLSTTGSGGYAPAAFGGSYYPATGGGTTLAALLNAGSQTAANAGLYHYTTLVDQTKEEATQVDIGFHYVSTYSSTSPAPRDSDKDCASTTGANAKDGIPDYLEDVNGNGYAYIAGSQTTPEPGETFWDRNKVVCAGNFTDSSIRYTGLPLDATGTGDFDADGRKNWDEYFAGTDPLLPTPAGVDGDPRLLHEWRFETISYSPGPQGVAVGTPTSEQGLAAAAGSVLSPVASFDGLAASFPAGSTGALRFPVTTTSGLPPTARPNISFRHGEVRLTYVADWNQGATGFTGPGQWCRLLECGEWKLSITPDGHHIVFGSPKAGGGGRVNLVAAVPNGALSTGSKIAWEIRLAYTRTGVWLWLNNTLLEASYSNLGGGGDGTGVEAAPTGAEWLVGNSISGTLPARGYIDHLQTFNAVGIVPDVMVDTLLALSWNTEHRRRHVFTANTVSAGLRLNWVRGWEGDPATVGANYHVERRALGATTWPATPLTASPVLTHTWTDTTAVPGAYYEYRLRRSGASSTWPTLVAARDGSPVDHRGRLLLAVDPQVKPLLTAELAAYKRDLIADGWEVVEPPGTTNVFRHADMSYPTPNIADYIANQIPTNKLNAQALKNWVVGEFNAHPTDLNVLFLVGHVTIPYSGSGAAEDNHDGATGLNHAGAWPTDAWYGCFSGGWTDDNNNLQTSTSSWERVLVRNDLNDGRWNQNALPGSLSVPIGRVDFHLMAPFKTPTEVMTHTQDDTEIRLLKSYFNKLNRWRRGDLAPASNDAACWIGDGRFYALGNTFKGMASRVSGSEPVGRESVTKDVFLEPATHLWGVHGDLGDYDRIGAGRSEPNLHVATDIAKNGEFPRASFLLVFGSYFGEWLHWDSDFMRTCLGVPDTAMAVSYINGFESGRWNSDRFHIGQPLGVCLQDTFAGDPSVSVRVTALLGDPTLREHNLPGVASLTAAKQIDSGTGHGVKLTWPAQAAASAGYRIYRANSASSSAWTWIGDASVGSTNWVHSSPGGVSGTDSNAYMIKAKSIQTTGAGSYCNLSLGTISNSVIPPY